MANLMRENQRRSSTGWLVLALVVFALSAGWLVQKAGCNQTSHYALVRALASGTTQIDAWQDTTCDKSYTDGHFYSNKAPGLALFTLPYYMAVDGLGLTTDSTRTSVWLLGLWGALLPAIGVLLLVRRAAERLEPGTGTLVALILAIATLALPLATLYFAHSLAALVVLAAFVLAWDGRRVGDVWRTAAAGVLAGLAVVVEYPLALVTVLLGLYVLSGSPRLRAFAAYCGGVAVGVTPLLVYNVLAFGSVTHLSYQDGVVTSGQSGHDVVRTDQVGDGTFFGIGTPRLEGLADVLLSSRGLLVITPVVALAVAGLALLWRRHRAEAAFLAATSLAVLLWNTGFRPAFGDPLGGDVPGPRYLVPVLPFLVLALAPVVRAAPRLLGLLALVSAATMILATLTEPMLGNDYTRAWIELAQKGDFTHTVLTLAGLGHGWLAILPALVGFVALVVAGAILVRRREAPESWLAAGLGVLVWAAVAAFVPDLVKGSAETISAGKAGLAVALAALPLAASVWFVSRSSRSQERPSLASASASSPGERTGAA